MWLYRIDLDTVFPCTRLDLQPPYCDAESPTLINRPFSEKHTTPLLPVSERMKPAQNSENDEEGLKDEDFDITLPKEIDIPDVGQKIFQKNSKNSG